MIKQGLPGKLLESLKSIKGFDEKTFIKIHNSGEQTTSIRINPSKLFSMGNDEPSSNIHHSPITIANAPLFRQEKVPWSSHGFYLSERPSFTLDPLFHAGIYYVQEASSMFLEEVLKQTADLSKPLRILDLCAAPGGKSTLIQSLISKNSLLVSNEVIKPRVNILIENITKWGAANVVVTNNDPKDFARLENYFDVIVVDAPCSGSGLFRKEPEAVTEWSEENVKLCSQRQRRIITDVWSSLKQNGILIYSTCSYSKEENEDILNWMETRFEVEGLRLLVENKWNVIETGAGHDVFGYRFYPDKLKGEGLFIAALQKKSGDGFLFPKTKKLNIERLLKNEETIIKNAIIDNAETSFFKKEDLIYSLPANLLDDFIFLRQSLYIKKAGVVLGKIVHLELIPHHELALSNTINPDTNSVELTKDQSLNYLRREEINIETNLKGWCLVKYQNHNLGWIKILPNRVNNYYPLQWKIRMM